MVCRLHISLVLGLVLALISVSSQYAAAEIYRWVDTKGQTHFGNVPPQPAKAYRPGFSAIEFDEAAQQAEAAERAARAKSKLKAPSGKQPSTVLTTTKQATTAAPATENVDVTAQTRRVDAQELGSQKASPEELKPSVAPVPSGPAIKNEKCGIFSLYVTEYEDKLNNCDGDVCEVYARQLERYRHYLRKNCR